MNVIVYGAGGNCKRVLELLSGEHIVAVADRDPAKIGTVLNGFSVISSQDILEKDFDRLVVSVDSNYAEICSYLEGLGIDKEKISHYQAGQAITPKNIGTMIADWDKNLTDKTIYDELCLHAEQLSEMEKEFLMGTHNRSFKWLHYFEIYNRHFKRYIGQDVTIMEIGVNRGGSLQIWKKVLGKNARIIGVDIDPSCKQFEEDQIQIYIGDQEDRNFWKKIKQEVPKLDILIDDGGHYMRQQIVTFEEMFPHVKEDGVYLCEDTSTSYAKGEFHAGYRQPDTFIEYSKNFIDYIHAWFSQDDALKVNEYTRTMHSLHYYPGVLAIEKRPMYPPFDMEICNNGEEKYAICHFHGQI